MSQPVKVVSLSKLHSVMWYCLMVEAMLWGMLTGASFFGDSIISRQVGVFGLLGNLVLGLTLVQLARTREMKREAAEQPLAQHCRWCGSTEHTSRAHDDAQF